MRLINKGEEMEIASYIITHDERKSLPEIFWNHFNYSIQYVDSYQELTLDEQNIISETLFNKITKHSHKQESEEFIMCNYIRALFNNKEVSVRLSSSRESLKIFSKIIIRLIERYPSINFTQEYPVIKVNF